jgi:hypothetical protein
MVFCRDMGELVSTMLPQIIIEGKPPKVTPWPSLFAQKPLWNKPNQVKTRPPFPIVWTGLSGG